MGKYNTRLANKRTQRTVNVSKESLPSVAGPDDENSCSIETNKKRKASKPPVEGEKDMKRSKKTSTTHDSYCWKCHIIDAEIECKTCPRSFHSYCVRTASKINDEGSCYVCQQQSIDKLTTVIDDEVHLSKLLLHIVDTACPMGRQEYKPIVDWPDSKANEKLICKKDFRLIHDKCIQKGMQYESPTELVDDVNWILHNCVIIFGENSSIAKSAKKVLKVIKDELNDALDCLECYYKKIGNEALTFLTICKTPHPLVWAKVKFYPFWPAKCLKVLNGKAHVRFFWTHQMSIVPLSKVFAMSENEPSSSAKKPDKKSSKGLDFIMAAEELRAYIDIFKDQYGSFPFRPANTPFNFDEEEKVIKDILEKPSRRYELDGRPTVDNELDGRPTVVDLTDDASEADEDQVHEDAASPIHEAESSFAENSSKLESIEQAISGSLLPSNHLQNPDERQYINWMPQRSPSPAPISISNVISGTEVPSDSGTELLAHCEAEPVMQNDYVMSMPLTIPDHFQSTSAFSQNSVSTSNSIQLCLRNYDRTSETAGFNDSFHSSAYPDSDEEIEIIQEGPSNIPANARKKSDVECILQTILRHDPKYFTILKQANMLVQQLFMQFWGSTSKLIKPEKVIQSQEKEIHVLKLQLDELRKQVSLMKDNYEERIQNADKILRSLKAELNKQAEKHKEEKEKQAEEHRKMIENYERTLNDAEKKFSERLEERRSIKSCTYTKCLERAKILCCYSGLNSYAYCSKECQAKDKSAHVHICKSVQNIGPSKPEEREEASSNPMAIARGVVQQSTTVIYSSVETRSVQSHISSKEKTSSSSPQQTSSSSNLKFNKVVAKKTVEVARNINRNHSSSDIY